MMLQWKNVCRIACFCQKGHTTWMQTLFFRKQERCLPVSLRHISSGKHDLYRPGNIFKDKDNTQKESDYTKSDHKIGKMRKQAEQFHEHNFSKLKSKKTVLEQDNDTSDYLKHSSGTYRSNQKHKPPNAMNTKSVSQKDESLDKVYKRPKQIRENWADTFGSLQNESDVPEFTELADNESYEEDIKKDDKETSFYNHIRLSRYGRRHSPFWYARRIRELEKVGKVKEAIEVFDKWMIQQDRVRPTSHEFSVLIALLGRCGYTQKAFKLYKQMRHIQVRVDPQIYTSLFNACINSPWREDGLSRARQLRQAMLLNNCQPTYITYQAMIQAFGVCGDINTAFSIADESARLKVTDNLLNSLLMACISDKTLGFRNAILVWRKLLNMGVKPTIKSYNLLLHAVNECGIGESSTVLKALSAESLPGDGYSSQQSRQGKNGKNELLDQMKKVKEFQEIDTLLEKYENDNVSDVDNVENDISSEERLITGETDDDENVFHSGEPLVEAFDLEVHQTSKTKMLENKEWWELDIFPVKRSQLSESVPLPSQEVLANLPNVLDPSDMRPMPDLDYRLVKGPKERFALLGGVAGLLSTLQGEGIQPDTITFSLMTKAIPLDNKQGNDLLAAMQLSGVRADADFYNHLMREVVNEGAWDVRRGNALELLSKMKSAGLEPNIRTYGILARVCFTYEQGRQFLEEILEAGVMPNSLIFYNLLKAAHFKFAYKKFLLAKMEELGVKPTEYLIELLETSIYWAKKDPEVGTPGGEHKRRSLEHFLRFYEAWCKRNVIETPEHPWKAFRENKSSSI